MTDEDIVQRVARWFDVKCAVEPRPEFKDVYRTQVSKAKLLDWIVKHI